VQLSRYGIKPTLFEGATPGGLLRQARRVENYPGFPAGVAGAELATLFIAHLTRTGATLVAEEVTSIALGGAAFVIRTAAGETRARAVIVASGTAPRRWEGVITPAAAPRVLYEVTPLIGAAGLHVVVVGAGDAAFDYALTLAAANRVTILARGRPRCLAALWEEARACPTVMFYDGAAVERLAASADGIITVFRRAGAATALTSDYVLFALGREPRLDFVPAEWRAAPPAVADGAFQMAGDVAHGSLRQVAIAAGDGVRAAVRAAAFIKGVTL